MSWYALVCKEVCLPKFTKSFQPCSDFVDMFFWSVVVQNIQMDSNFISIILTYESLSLGFKDSHFNQISIATSLIMLSAGFRGIYIGIEWCEFSNIINEGTILKFNGKTDAVRIWVENINISTKQARTDSILQSLFEINAECYGTSDMFN